MSETVHASVKEEVIGTAVSGEVVALENVNDPVFSSGMMGKGIAVKPNENKIYAPADGLLTVVNASKHAYGLQTASGAEVLIHIGIDTVNLNGKHFETSRKQGEQVRKGDVLAIINREGILDEGYDDTVIMVVTNSDSFEQIEALEKTSVQTGEDILKVSKMDAN